MGLLTCGCLNVKIHVKNTDLKQLDPRSLDDIDPNEEFFLEKISAAHLNLEGVIVEHWCLVKKKVVGLWTLHRCINCGLWTHAIKREQGTSLILVNMALRSAELIITALGQSSDFSPLYKVVLPDRNDNQPIHTLGVESGQYESLQQVLTTIQQQLNKFLINEENVMEERIKQYEDSQRATFADLQKKARQDKNNMIRMILKAEDRGEDQVDFSQRGLDNDRLMMSQSARLESQRIVAPTKPLKATSFDAANDAQKPQPIVHSHTNTSAAKVSASQPYSKSVSALSSRLGGANNNRKDDGVLFDMDSGFDPTFAEDDGERPFYNSDDEENEESTDDSEPASPALSAALYSTSVPISVPAWKLTHKSRHKQQEQEDESPPDPDNIAASIKALAKSVHGDGKQIFGELPRGPRQQRGYGATTGGFD